MQMHAVQNVALAVVSVQVIDFKHGLTPYALTAEDAEERQEQRSILGLKSFIG